MDSISMSMPGLFSSPRALFSIHQGLENGALQVNNSLQGELNFLHLFCTQLLPSLDTY